MARVRLSFQETVDLLTRLFFISTHTAHPRVIAVLY